MTKKKWMQTGIFILLPILALWIYLQFFQARYLFLETQEMDVKVSDTRSIVLKSDQPTLSVNLLEIEVSGKLNGIMDVALENSDGLVQFISLKGPKVDHFFQLPWQEHSCTLRFNAREDASASFHLRYRFIESE